MVKMRTTFHFENSVKLQQKKMFGDSVAYRRLSEISAIHNLSKLISVMKRVGCV